MPLTPDQIRAVIDEIYGQNRGRIAECAQDVGLHRVSLSRLISGKRKATKTQEALFRLLWGKHRPRKPFPGD